MSRLPLWIVWAALSVFHQPGIACGPSPQKVVETIEITAPMSRVVTLLEQPEAMPQWHPMVQAVHAQPVITTSEENPTIQHSEIVFRNGWVLQQALKAPVRPGVIEDSRMSGGSFPISQYRGVLEVLPSANPGTVILVWSARFNNQANLLDAPTGQDNATAVAAVTIFYRQGLQGIKHLLETTPPHYSYNIKENQ